MKKGPFKMKGFGGFGNSPVKQDKSKFKNAKENLIPNKTEFPSKNDIFNFRANMKPTTKDKITKTDITNFITNMKPKANATFIKTPKK